MKKIAVFTGTRAEYGLLNLILKGLQQSKNVELQLFVGGTHLSHDFGYTIKHIISYRVPANVYATTQQFNSSGNTCRCT